MASVLITHPLTSHAAGLGGKRGGCSNSSNAAVLLVPCAPSPWPASRVVLLGSTSARAAVSCSKITCRSLSPRASVQQQQQQPTQQILTRKSFPPAPQFVFGAGTSSYQVEGAWDEGGKGPSVWDHFCHTYPERIADGSNGEVAVNSYHMYEDDVKMLKEMGMDAYRFSFSWPRILPKGTLQGGINEEGIKYYNNLIDKLHYGN